MSLPTSLRAYEDCKNLYDAAAADPKGARACLGTYESCVQMRTRMHYFRSLDRRANEDIYPKGHQMWGVSAYDDYFIQIQQDQDRMFWLYIQPRSARVLYVEGLSEVGDLIDVDSEEVHMIEDKTGGSA
jgi:hypothetical protein